MILNYRIEGFTSWPNPFVKARLKLLLSKVLMLISYAIIAKEFLL